MGYPRLIVGTSLKSQQGHPEASDGYSNESSPRCISTPPQNFVSVPTHELARIEPSQQQGSCNGLRPSKDAGVESQPMQRHDTPMSGCDEMQLDHQSNTGGNDLRPNSSGESIPRAMEGSNQDPEPRTVADYLREFGVLSERQISDALSTFTRGEAVPIKRFIADDNRNVYAQSFCLPASGHQPLGQKHCLASDISPSSPPSKKHEGNRDRRYTKTFEDTTARRNPEQRLDEQQQRQRRKQGILKKKISRARAEAHGAAIFRLV